MSGRGRGVPVVFALSNPLDAQLRAAQRDDQLELPSARLEVIKLDLQSRDDARRLEEALPIERREKRRDAEREPLGATRRWVAAEHSARRAPVAFAWPATTRRRRQQREYLRRDRNGHLLVSVLGT